MDRNIESIYQGALLADAAYVDFGDIWVDAGFSPDIQGYGEIPDTDYARDEFLKRGFTADQFNAFRERYEIIDHVQSNISGLSATLFRDKFDGGKPILAFRGTETTLNAAPADLITDLLLTLGIDEAGMQAPGQEGLMDEWRDAGHFSADNPLTVVGHSLGGHLSLKAAAEYNDLVSDVVTFNGAGINPIEDLFVSDQLDPSKVTRVVSEPGFEVTANDFFFKQYGDTEHRLFIHKQSLVSDYESFSDLAIGNHSMVHLVDTFSVMRLLEAVW